MRRPDRHGRASMQTTAPGGLRRSQRQRSGDFSCRSRSSGRVLTPGPLACAAQDLRQDPGSTINRRAAEPCATPADSRCCQALQRRAAPPHEMLPTVTDAKVRSAACAELCGYWAWATRRPLMWVDPMIADLGLTAMARGRHAMRTGDLLTKTQAIEAADAPRWLIEQLRARRRDEHVVSPRILTGWIAWRDARRTVSAARTSQPPPE
jgi:hypothetical protein